MKKKISYAFVVLICTLCLAGCSLRGILSSNKSNKVTNEVTNNITENTVNYGNLSVNDLEGAVETVAKRVQNAVVGVTLKQVTTVSTISSSVVSEDDYSYGSAVIFKKEKIDNDPSDDVINNYRYYAITNAHVVTPETTSTKATYNTYAYLGYNDLEIPCTVVGKDTKADVACITFDTYADIEPVKIADSDTVEKGSFAIAIGNPEGYDYYGSCTFGVISGLNRYLSSDTDGDNVNDFVGVYIQHDVTINPGNSGGGLFNLSGELIGINTLKITLSNVDNMGFAIPSNVAKKLVTEYFMENKEIVRPRLGIVGIGTRNLSGKTILQNNLKEIPDIYNGEKAYGIYITTVDTKGSCANSGLQKDDILLTFDGQKITSNDMIGALLAELTKYTVGMQVEITYYSRSKGTTETSTITLKSN